MLGRGLAEASRIGEARVLDGGRAVEVAFRIGGEEHAIFFRVEGAALSASREAFLTAALLPCMAARTDLEGVGEVDARLLSSVPAIQGIFCSWEKGFRRVGLPDASARLPSRAPAPGGRVGLFFSGGLDSFYTLLSRRDEITDLIFLRGFDIRVEEEDFARRAADSVRQAAAAFGKGVVEIRSNLRSMLDARLDWGLHAHGAALASMAHLLAPAFRRMFISGSHPNSDSFPWGSHPALDPLWSSEGLEIVHFGGDVDRVRKSEAVARHDVALRLLRVCWENPDGAYNCGRCEKCLRTMINLAAAGALERCPAFPVPLEVERVRRLRLVGENERIYARENLEALESRGGDPALALSLREALARRYPVASLARRLRLRLLRHPRAYRAVRAAVRAVVSLRWRAG